jgi:hypothetical protein
MTTYRDYNVRGSIFLVFVQALLTIGGGRALANTSLDEQTLARSERVFSWTLGLTLGQRDQFRRNMQLSWDISSEAEKAKLLGETLPAVEKVMALDADRREAVRLALAENILARLRKDPTDPLARFLLAEHDVVHPPLAGGNPPLQAEMALATVHLARFMTCEARGQRYRPLPPPVLAAQVAELARRWPDIPPAERANMAKAATTYAALQTSWARTPEKARQAARQLWRKRLLSIAKAPRSKAPAHESNLKQRDPAEYSRRMTQLYQQMSNYNADVAFLSNMSRMQHDTTMTIIDNIRPSSTQRWNPMRGRWEWRHQR